MTDSAPTTAIKPTEQDERPRVLSEAAQRALAEAEVRRQELETAAKSAATEVGGRQGPDPVRYGDWEKGGIAWDF
jgi:hypothetical protein